MKITIEKDNYDHTTESFKTTTIVYETNEASLFESFQIINKAFSIVAINSKYDWRDRLFDGLYPTGIDAAAPVLYPVPATAPFPTLPTWSLMRPLTGDPIGQPNSTIIWANNTSAMPQADGMGDDSKGSTRYDPTGVEDDDIPF